MGGSGLVVDEHAVFHGGHGNLLAIGVLLFCLMGVLEGAQAKDIVVFEFAHEGGYGVIKGVLAVLDVLVVTERLDPVLLDGFGSDIEGLGGVLDDLGLREIALGDQRSALFLGWTAPGIRRGGG